MSAGEATRCQSCGSRVERGTVHCGPCLEPVRAIKNAGEWYTVEDRAGELVTEAAAEQCEGCGSFTEAGEPGPGFYLVREVPPMVRGDWSKVGPPPFYACGCCGWVRYISTRHSYEVVQ